MLLKYLAPGAEACYNGKKASEGVRTVEEKYVFISYKVEEYDTAKAVKDHLEANAVPCWMAPMSIRGGMSYAQEIPPAIQNSSVFLLILSEKAQQSKWVPRELDQAINCEKVIMPYMVEDCKLRSDFSFYLTNVQRYEAFRDPEETLTRMTRDIQKELGITPPAPKPEAESMPEAEIPPVAEAPKAQKKPKQPKKEKACNCKKKKLLPLILCGGLLLVALLIALLLPGKKTIGNLKLEKDSFSINLEDVTLTQKDINGLSDFKNLCIIRLKNCTLEAQDLSPMAVSGLMALELSNCKLTDAQFATIDFSKLNSFTELRVNGNPDLTDIAGVAVRADKLRQLDISDTGIQSFDWLSSFTRLDELRADRMQLQDTTLLESMIYLEELSLSGNGITSLEGLKNTSKLSKVDLSHNSLTDVSVLSRSEATLTVLHLENNDLADLSCLSNAKELKKVYVDGNELESLTWLKESKELQILTASHNRLWTITGLGIGEKLQYLNLSHNALWDIAEGDLVFGADAYLIVDLSYNQLSGLQLPQNCRYKHLALLGNPDLNIAAVGAVKGWSIYFDFSEGTELETLKALGFNSLYIVGCPLDRQVEIEEGLNTENLVTEEEALEAIAAAESSENY